MKKQKIIKRSEISDKTFNKIMKANEKKKRVEDKVQVQLDIKPLSFEEVLKEIREGV